ncbi:MAG: acyl carrier protein [Steroidobacteraceae bacterium]
MTDEKIIAKLQQVFTGVFGKSLAFDPMLDRRDASHWTSLKHVEFIIALEREFGVRFDGADATDMTSIPLVIERIQQRLQ